VANLVVVASAIGRPAFNNETFQRIMMNDSTHYFLVSLAFLVTPPVTFFLIPMIVYSFFHVSNFINKNIHKILPESILRMYKAFIEPRITVALSPSNQHKVLLWCAQCEFVTMVILVINTLFGAGSILSIFSYFWFLNFRYLTNADARTVFDSIGFRLDSIFYGPSSPALVQTAYRWIRGALRRTVTPQASQAAPGRFWG